MNKVSKYKIIAYTFRNKWEIVNKRVDFGVLEHVTRIPFSVFIFLPIQGGLHPIKRPLAKLIQKRGLGSPAVPD